MIEKHKRKLFLHNKIYDYFIILSKEEQIRKIEILKEYIKNINNSCITNKQWLNILNNFTNCEDLFNIILEKNDNGELLRHTSYFAAVIPQELILEWKKEWFGLSENDKTDLYGNDKK